MSGLRTREFRSYAPTGTEHGQEKTKTTQPLPEHGWIRRIRPTPQDVHIHNDTEMIM
jgi:hypothetical protein